MVEKLSRADRRAWGQRDAAALSDRHPLTLANESHAVVQDLSLDHKRRARHHHRLRAGGEVR